MIISANRLSSINGRINIGINENYGSEDLGRILMEDAMNDMAIFNASIMHDYHEIKVRQEGTMLESEIKVLSENGIQDFCKKIIDKLKSFWAKMKAWFKTAIANVSAYVVRGGSAFVKMHLKDISDLEGNDKCGKRWYRINNNSISQLAENLKGEIEEDSKKLDRSSITDEMINTSATDMVKGYYGVAIGGNNSFNDGDNFFKKAKETYFKEEEDVTITKMGGTTKLIATLQNGKENIKTLKEIQNKMDKIITDVIKAAEKTAKKVKDENEDNKKHYKYLQNLSSASTTAVATVSKACIKLVKFEMAECRKALATAIGRHARTESTLLESMLFEADEEIEELSDNDYATDLTPAEEKAVEDLVDAIEDKLDSCDDDE